MSQNRRSLWPREHGAYAQLGFPLVTALVAGRPTLASLALALASMAAFVAHEPLAVTIGVRGPRARRDEGARARRWLVGLGGAALALGAAGFWLAPAARVFAVVAGAFAAVAGAILWARKERTRAGEIVAATALAGAAAPVAASAGVHPFWVLACWAVWSAQSAMSTLAVRAIVTRAPAWPTLVATASLLLAGSLAGRSIAIALAPMAVACSVIVLSSLSPKSLRAAGLALAFAMLFSAASLVVGART